MLYSNFCLSDLSCDPFQKSTTYFILHIDWTIQLISLSSNAIFGCRNIYLVLKAITERRCEKETNVVKKQLNAPKVSQIEVKMEQKIHKLTFKIMLAQSFE